MKKNVFLFFSEKVQIMASDCTLWLAVSTKCGERNIVLPVTVEVQQHETSMDLLEKVMARNTSKTSSFDVKNVSLCIFPN